MLKLNAILLAALTMTIVCQLATVEAAGKRRHHRKAASSKRQAMIPVPGGANHGDSHTDFYDPAEEEYDFGPVHSPCMGVQRGDPDLTTYDIISSYRFDEYHYAYQGMQQIVGSTGYQTAYRFEEYTNMTIESMQAFPQGFPDEFSFECTFRVPQHQPANEWNLFELANYELESLMSVTMNPIYRTIDFSLPKYDGSIQTVSFEESQIFDYDWHKVMLGVSQDSVRLWVDCKPVPHTNGSYHAPLDVRSPIDASDGVFTVAKNCQNRQTVPIDLQWMIFSCDVDKPDHTNCEDLQQYALTPKGAVRPEPRPTPMPRPAPIPVPDDIRRPDTQPDMTPRPDPDLSFLSSSTRRPWILTSTPASLIGEEVHAKVCPEQCPIGPAGYPGEKGAMGAMGPPGPPGVPGTHSQEVYARQEVRGEKGDTGDQGERGERGERGEKGEHGERGLDGSPGPMGPAGPVGQRGLAGPPGQPGAPGAPGLDGQPGQNSVTEYSRGEGQSVSDSDIRDICMTVVREYISEISSTLIGPPGPPGRRGASRAGPPGPAGIQGDPGIRGQQGDRGYPGVPGIPGSQGEAGVRGDEGQKGERGDDGIGREGPMGPPGATGPEGRPGQDGRAGRPGDQGETGRAGEPGVRGPDGAPGICDCSNQQALYAYPMMLAQQQQNNKGPPSYYNNKGPQNYNNKGP